MADVDAIVCMLRDDCPEPVRGSTLARCALCQREVWVAPSTLPMLAANPTAPIWCAADALRMADRVQEN